MVRRHDLEDVQVAHGTMLWNMYMVHDTVLGNTCLVHAYHYAPYIHIHIYIYIFVLKRTTKT